MTEAIWVGLISGGVTLITSLTATILVFISNNKKLRQEQEAMFTEQVNKQNERIDALQKEIKNTLDIHKQVYLEQINEVHTTISEIKAENQQYQAVFTLKIDALEKKQDAHNQVITRMYEAERNICVLDNREKVSEKRLADLERICDRRKKDD